MARLRDLVLHKTTRATCSQVVEDMFNVVKSATDRKSNSVAGHKFAMAKVIDSQLLETKHHFTEVSRQSEIIPRSTEFPDTAFTPALRKDRLDERMKQARLTDISGREEATWYSPGAVGYCAPFADLQALRDADRSGQWELLGDRSYCRLIQRSIGFRRVGTEQWFLGVGSIDGSVAIGWPLERAGEDSYRVKAAGATRVLFTILKLEDWEAMAIRFISPLHQAVDRERMAKGGWASHFVDVDLKASRHYGQLPIQVERVGAVMGLFQISALHAFWMLPLSFLKEICDKREIAYPSIDLVSILEALAKAAIPTITVDELCAIMDRRNLYFEEDVSACDDIVNCEWVVDSFDRDMSETMKTEVESSKGRLQQHADFKEDVMKYKALFACMRPCVFPLFATAY